MTSEKKKSFGKSGLFLFIAVAAFIIGINFLNINNSPKSPVPDIGQNARLVSPDGKDVFIATTELAYEAERKAIIAGDSQGLVILMLAGQLFTAPNGTDVLIIDRGSYMRKVRITSGEFVRLSGWVSDEFVE